MSPFTLSLQYLLDMYTVCTYNYSMIFEWDQNKATSNQKKHSVDFAMQ
jgi:hypothetical protein